MGQAAMADDQNEHADNMVETADGRMVEATYIAEDRVRRQPCIKMTYYQRRQVGREQAWKEYHRVFVFAEEAPLLVATLLSSGMLDAGAVTKLLAGQPAA